MLIVELIHVVCLFSQCNQEKDLKDNWRINIAKVTVSPLVKMYFEINLPFETCI